MTVQSIEKTAPLRTANKAALAEWFGVSVATVDNWLRRGCPSITRGSRGQALEFGFDGGD